VYLDLTVAVVVPAFNEAREIARTLRGIPPWVDRVIVVDDGSRDATPLLARRARARGIEIVRHPANRGVGAAIVTGYRRALALGHDVAVVMAGDGQMDPADLPALLAPIAAGRAGYVKGNRFRHAAVWREMPVARLVGNILLSLATKVVSGYTHLFDSQCGYTAISRGALAAIDLDRVFPRYGYPNDLLARLHAAGVHAVDVAVRPVYGPRWKSGINLLTVLHPIAGVLARALGHRLRVEWLGAPARPALPPASEPERSQADPG
jgi:glycosyltransferase involved in cell wall biosynthesis